MDYGCRQEEKKKKEARNANIKKTCRCRHREGTDFPFGTVSPLACSRELQASDASCAAICTPSGIQQAAVYRPRRRQTLEIWTSLASENDGSSQDYFS